MMIDKQTLRKQLREKRRLLDSEIHQQLSTRIAQTVIASPYFQNSQKVACYLPQDAEVDTQLIIKVLWQQHKQCFLPIVDLATTTLNFALYPQHCKLTQNCYGIPEPVNTTLLRAGELDLIIAPLVGFDQQHNRLGMGKGFYDRTLAHCKNRKPVFVGLAFSFQKLEALPHEQHDAKLDFVVTEQWHVY